MRKSFYHLSDAIDLYQFLEATDHQPELIRCYARQIYIVRW